MSTVVEHQPRERAVPCARCRRDTWEISAVCLDCQRPPADTCPTCKGDPQSVERYSSGRSVQTVPADCPRCGARNPLAHVSGF